MQLTAIELASRGELPAGRSAMSRFSGCNVILSTGTTTLPVSWLRRWLRLFRADSCLGRFCGEHDQVSTDRPCHPGERSDTLRYGETAPEKCKWHHMSSLMSHPAVHLEAMKPYREKAFDTLIPYGGKPIVRTDHIEVREVRHEKAWTPTRLLIIEFPTLAAAQAWY